MAALGFVEVIGLISGGLGIIQFGLDNFAPKEETGSVIRISVGLDGNGLSEAGGDLPDVRLFNDFGEFLGIAADPGSVGPGSTEEIKVTHSDGQQAAYTLFTANDNAICIATTSITWADGSQYGWLGDWAQECNYDWFHSNVFVSGTSKKPKCMWIDANGDREYTAFQLHWPSFAPTVPPNLRSPDSTDSEVTEVTTSEICSGGPIFNAVKTPDPRGIIFKTPTQRRGLSRFFRRRPKPPIPTSISANATNSTASRSQPKYRDQIVLDYSPDNSARELCESPTSRGPDFANLAEGLFCRMLDKTLWPLCSDSIIKQCFSVESKQIVTGQVTVLNSPSKKYSKVVTWK